MSKFFRSPSSDSISSQESSSGSIVESPTEEDRNLARHDDVEDITASLARLSSSSPRSFDHSLQSQVLLHALLEERCINEASREHRRTGDRLRDEEAIQNTARAKYQHLCHILSPHNLISAGLDDDRFATTRRQYVAGLDLLKDHKVDTGKHRIPAVLPRAVSDYTGLGLSTAVTPSLQLSRLLKPVHSASEPFSLSHPLLEPSRYRRDFEVLGLLGKGGFGVVYRVRNRIDDFEYAIKKVPISSARLARIQSRGQQELDELLREVRTMARLDHPNIVRYFAGWIEWSGTSTHPHNSVESSWQMSEADAVAGAQANMASLDRVMTETSSTNADIQFEASTSQASHQALWSHNGETSIVRRDVNLNRSAFASHADDYSNLSGVVTPALNTPTLALHLQMGLYPLTLADFMLPAPTSHIDPKPPPPLRHCFHLQPAIEILSCLLDGVEYLHSQGIIHRDLKPANIFLAANTNPRSLRGSVDLFLCEACRAAGVATPVQLQVRIGDFGLVSLARPDDVAGDGEEWEVESAVGTELYRPATALTVKGGIGLDVYALGIIAFELFWRVDTRMERLEAIKCLRSGEFPDGFEERLGECGGAVKKCIMNMLAFDMVHSSLDTVRQEWLAIQAMASSAS